MKKEVINIGKIRRSKNSCFVTIRADRNCHICRGIISKGTKCLTINPKFGDRYWVCNTCYNLSHNIAVTKAELNNLPFDDEGAVLAYMDFLSELEGELEERQC